MADEAAHATRPLWMTTNRQRPLDVCTVMGWPCSRNHIDRMLITARQSAADNGYKDGHKLLLDMYIQPLFGRLGDMLDNHCSTVASAIATGSMVHQIPHLPSTTSMLDVFSQLPKPNDLVRDLRASYAAFLEITRRRTRRPLRPLCGSDRPRERFDGKTGIRFRWP